MNKNKSVSTARVFNSKFTSTLSISLVLFLVGVMLALGLLTRQLSNYVKEHISISVVIDDEMPLPDAKMLEKHLKNSVWAKSVQYIDKETALKELVEELGENPEDLLGYNPTLASYEVNLTAEYAHADSINLIEKQLKKRSHIQDIIYRKDLVQMVNDNVKRISLFLSLLAVLMTFITYSLIRNTVKLMIYSKRFIIRTMQLVGADRSFIMKPFLLENLWSGIAASVLAMGLLYGLLLYLDQRVVSVAMMLDWVHMGIIFAIILVFGMLIMMTSTLLAVNRFIRMNTNDLYFV